ncbi:ABC transporter permease, partial [Thioclava sp. BHET1]
TPQAVAGLRKAMGLDEPAIYRFLGWLFGLLTGNLGTSYVNHVPVADLISGRLVNSLKLAGITTAVSVPLSLFLGIGAAMWRGSIFDRLVSILTITVISVPEFMVATLAVLIFAVWLGWLPALSYGVDVSSWGAILKAYAMPVITLTFVISAQMI